MSASSKRVLLPLRPRRRRAPSRPTPGTELGESRRGPLPPITPADSHILPGEPPALFSIMFNPPFPAMTSPIADRTAPERWEPGARSRSRRVRSHQPDTFYSVPVSEQAMEVPEVSEEEFAPDAVELLTDEEEDVTQQSNDDLEEKKQELEKMCGILGVNYKMKLAEFGSKVDKERVDEALTFLRVTRDSNFDELKTISAEIIKEWKASNTPFKTMYKISWILYIHDSASADEVKGQNLLSFAFVNKARKDLTNLQKERDNRYRKKYLVQRNKLIGILEEMHLTSSDVQFVEKKPVSTDEYKSEKRKVKHIIRKVKADAARKELVLRIELIRQAIYNGWQLEDIDDLIENAKYFAAEMIEDVEVIPYDGQYVVDVLRKLRKDARKSATDHDEKNKPTAGLRSGNQYKK